MAFRNAAILVGLWALFLAVVQDWAWALVSTAIVIGLVAMHQMHNKVHAQPSYATQVQAANAAARQQLGDQ